MRLARREMRLIAGVALATVGVAALIIFLLPRSYSSETSFTPQGRKLPSNLSGIAAQFGVNIPAGDASESPQFYADLLTSREVLAAAVVEPLRGESPATKVTLLSLYGGTDRDEARRRDDAIRRLKTMLTVSVSAQTGVVHLVVKAEQPLLANDLARELLSLVNNFNLQRRRSRASSEREFLERRSRDVERELRQAEDRLQNFLQGNRSPNTNAPSLRFQEERLTRDERMEAQLYSSVMQAYEQAKLEEVRDTPVITIVEDPEVAARPDSRHVALKLAVALVLGTLIGMVATFLREKRTPATLLPRPD